MALSVIERPVSSLEPIRVPVNAEVNGVQFNPTTMTVEMGFVLDGVAGAPSAWQSGIWDTDTTPSTGIPIYKAQVKPIGLAAGTYTIWLRLTGTDTVVRIVGILKLT